MASNPEPLAAAAPSRLQKHTIHNAVTSLLKHKSAAQSATGKLQLLPDDDYVYLTITLKKIPSNPRTNPFKISLPHPILDTASQLCLFVDDRPKSPTPPSDQIKKLIKALDIPIAKVIKISKLKTNYKPFEAKRKLCDSYDLFLVDKRVVHLLPKLLGKEFFKKKKLPLGVDMSKKNLKEQVERALGSALFYLRTGTCCVMKVGKMAMEKDEIVENVVDAVNGAVERVAKKWDGVRSLFLKFSDTLALPLYQAMPDVKLKIEGLKEMEKKAELAIAKSSDNEGEVNDVSGRKDSNISKKKNKKGRIHEVHYMDVGEDIQSADDVDGSEKVKGEAMKESDVDDSEKVKSDAMEESGDHKMIQDEDLTVKGSLGKKGKQVKKALKERASEVSNGPIVDADKMIEAEEEEGASEVRLKRKAKGKKGKKDGPIVDADKTIEAEMIEAEEVEGASEVGLKRKAKGKKGKKDGDADKMIETEVGSVGKKLKKKLKKAKGLKEGASEVLNELSVKGPVEKKGKTLKEGASEVSKGALGVSNGQKRKAKGKKDESPSEDVPAETKGKKKTKSELGELSSEKIANVKDVRRKKRLSANQK